MWALLGSEHVTASMSRASISVGDGDMRPTTSAIAPAAEIFQRQQLFGDLGEVRRPRRCLRRPFRPAD